MQNGLSWLIVASIVAVHACTLSCSLGFYACGIDLGLNKSVKASSCCSGKDAGKNEGNCQNEHLAFFNTLGKSAVTGIMHFDKFFSGTNTELKHPFTFPAIIQSNLAPSSHIFHPPPADADILLFIGLLLI